MNYSLHILPRAENDFLQMFAFIEERSPAGAEAWRHAFEAGLKRLRENPFIHGLAPEDVHFDFELRQLLFKTTHGRTYRVVYRVDDNVVTIYRVRGPGQAPLKPDEMPPG